MSWTKRLAASLGLVAVLSSGFIALPAVAAGTDTFLVHDAASGRWTTTGGVSFYYGNPGDSPLLCDWNRDGSDSVGLYRDDGFLYLRNSNTQGHADVKIFYGLPGDRPVCGDWNGDGTDTIGIFRPSNQTFYLRNSNTQGFGELTFKLGTTADLPFAGDWDGDGWDTVGVRNPTSGKIVLADRKGIATSSGFFGAAGDRLVVGDFDGNGRDSLAVQRNTSLLVANDLGNSFASAAFAIRATGHALAGRWAGSTAPAPAPLPPPPPTTTPPPTPTTPPPTPTTPPPTPTTPPPTSTTPPPANCVTLAVGQPDIDAHLAGTIYCVPEGTHAWSLRPKSGDTIVGLPGAVLDGGGSINYAIWGNASNLTVRSLEVRNYAPPSSNGMIQFDIQAAGIVLQDLDVHGSSHAGIKASNGMLITGGRFWNNGTVGIAGTSANDVTIEGVEIDGNNSRNLDHEVEAGGVKWVGDRMVIRNCYVHHNKGKGLWADIDSDGSLIEGNLIEGNDNEGILIEISTHAVIRNNVANRNGLIKHEWLWGGGITISSSGYVEIYGNTLADNGNGITGVQQNRPDGGTSHLLQDLFVHDNTVSSPGRSDVAEDNGTDLTTRNIRFVNNQYLNSHQGRVG